MQMVELCVRHNLSAEVEHLPLERINEAVERLRKGDVRYRFVLDQV